MTQHERIIEMFKYGPQCGTDFLAAYLPTYSQRIGELKKLGWRIYRTECKQDHHHHQSGIATYELSKYQGGTYDDEFIVSMQGEGPEPPVRDDFDEQYADMKARANDPPDPEPPGDDVEDTFHTMIVWPDDEADHGHDSAVDQAAGEGLQ